MRKLNFTLLILLMIGGGIYLAPFVSSEPVLVPAPELTKEQKQRKKADEFFNGPIVSLEINLPPEEVERLKKDQRNYAEATLKEVGGKGYKGVAIKLKGAAGSFQGIDGKPGMTLSFDKFKDADRFHGMKKFHLNNCAQDGTYLSEMIAGEIGRKVGVPASRCTHAFVKINGRDLGIYVIKEAFTKDFLSQYYTDVSGDLWDGGFCREIDENSEKDQGEPSDKSVPKEIVAACREGDQAKRWERVGKVIDIEKFVAFAAMEDVMCHWDGYNFNRNNYRFYRDPSTGKVSFFLHGMDQMFGDPNFPVIRDFGSMVGGAIIRHPEGAKMYRAKVESVYSNVLKGGEWPARVTELGNKLRDAIAAKDPNRAKEYQGRIGEMRSRVEQRIAVLAKQFGDAPKPGNFDKDNVLKLTEGWNMENSSGGDAAMDEAQSDGKKCLHLKANNASTASWRKVVNLPPGKYRFEARVKTAGVQAMDDAKNKGAALRISGGAKGTEFSEGDSGWKAIAYPFESPGADVVLVAELRAQKGEAWFDRDSLRVVWVK